MKFSPKHAVTALAGLVLGTALVCGTGLLAQLLRNQALWQQGGRIGTPTLPSLRSDSMREALCSRYGVRALLLLALVAGSAALIWYSTNRSRGGEQDTERNFAVSAHGTYGTAGFLTEAERKQVLELKPVEQTQGVILGALHGKVLSLPPDSRMNRNVMVYGASGTMKSRAYVRNRIFQSVLQGESLVITDSKGELYCDCAAYLRDQGYEVRVFNLVDPTHSDGWNPLQAAHGNELLIQTMADVIIRNSGGGQDDKFWSNAECNLLKALLLYVDNSYDESQRNLGAVYDLLASGQSGALESIGEHLPAEHPAKSCFSIFLQSSDTVRAGAISGLAGRLNTLQVGSIRAVTSHADIDLLAPGQRRCATFCIISDQDSAFEFLSSLFFALLFAGLVRLADQSPGGHLAVPVHILGDELMNCGTIPDLGRKLSVLRSRQISITIAVQSLGQLQNRYPDNTWLEIIGNCDTTLFLGCTYSLTAALISERSGDVTVDYNTQARTYSSVQLTRWTPEYRETDSLGKRKLLTVDEVLRLPLNRELIILRGQKVLLAEKFDYTRHPHTKLLRPANVSEYRPAWYGQPVTPTTPPQPKRAKPAAKSKPTKAEEPLSLRDPHQLFM